MAHLRWWAEKVGKAGILPADNTKLGIPERRYVTNESRAKELGNRLDRITDPYVRMSLRLQSAFGLRREESIKFQPRYADRGNHIAIKPKFRTSSLIQAPESPAAYEISGFFGLFPEK